MWVVGVEFWAAGVPVGGEVEGVCWWGGGRRVGCRGGRECSERDG